MISTNTTQSSSKQQSKLSPLRNNAILYASIEKKALEQLEQLQASFLPTRFWLHIEIHCLFEAIEERNNRSLKNNEYVIMSSDNVKGYNRIKCSNLNLNHSIKDVKHFYPNAEIIRCAYDKYLTETKKVCKLLLKYDKNMKRIDWNEFYLDLTLFLHDNYASSKEDFIDVLREIKEKIIEELSLKDLNMSLGFGGNKLISKLASMQSFISKHPVIILNNVKDISSFIGKISLETIPFVSNTTKQQLKDINIKCCGELLSNHVDIFYLYEKKYAALMGLAIGIGPDEHDEIKESKPISYREDITKDIGVLETFNLVASKVAKDMLELQFKGKTLTVEVVDDKKRKTAKSLTLAKKFESEREIKFNGEQLLKELQSRQINITTICVKISALIKKNNQTTTNNIDTWLRPNNNASKNKNATSLIKPSSKTNKGMISKGKSKSLPSQDLKYVSTKAQTNINIIRTINAKTPKKRSKAKIIKPKCTLDSFLSNK